MNYQLVFIYFSESVPSYFENYYNIVTKCEDIRENGKEKVLLNNILDLDVRFIKYNDINIKEKCRDDKTLEINRFIVLDVDTNYAKVNMSDDAKIFIENIEAILDEDQPNKLCILKDKHIEFNPAGKNIKNIPYFEKVEFNFFSDMIYVMRSMLQYIYSIKNCGSCDKYSVFISHTKKDCADYVRYINNILENYKINTFFDVKDIYKSIENDINEALDKTNCGMIVISSDNYSSRPWCVFEIGAARRRNIPVIVLDTVKTSSSRVLQYVANYKSIRVDSDEISNDKINKLNYESQSLIRAVAYLLFQSLVKENLLNRYDGNNNVAVLTHQPTAIDVIDNKSISGDGDENTDEIIIYPEPVMLYEEKKLLEKVLTKVYSDSFKVMTNIEYNTNVDNLETNKKELKTLHISTSIGSDLSNSGYIPQQYLDFINTLVRYTYYYKNSIAYFGDFDMNRNYNITDIILEYSSQYIEEFKRKNFTDYADKLLYVNGLNVESSTEDSIYVKLNNYLGNSVEIVTAEKVSTENLLTSRLNHENHLKKLMENNDTHLIVVGGSQQKDTFSGVINEILLYIIEKKPIYVIGNFGGAAEAFGKFLRDKKIDALDDFIGKSEDVDLKNYRKDRLALLKDCLNHEISHVFNNNLTDDENLTLIDNFTSLNEKLELIIKGVN